ncbi:MAG: hypothetical protein LZF62_300055 [Nitrospira sp.]|nr:MAG: hypothetical protein LZF62_300055 [Nitrospira sp.]
MVGTQPISSAFRHPIMDVRADLLQLFQSVDSTSAYKLSAWHSYIREGSSKILAERGPAI